MHALKRRLAILEAKVSRQVSRCEPELPTTDYLALRAKVHERFDQILAPPPSGTAGIRHYRKEIAEAEHWASVVPPADVLGKTNWAALNAAFAPTVIPIHRHGLRGCELDVLAAAGFDPTRSANWRKEHDKYRGLSGRWRREELPADAMAVIEAALEREAEHELLADAPGPQ